MAVYVNYGAGEVIYDAEDSASFTSDVFETVQERATETYDYLKSLEATADFAASEALTTVELLKNFSASVPPISFVAPDTPEIEGFSMDIPAPAPLTYPERTPNEIENNFEYRLSDARRGTWDLPDDFSLVIPPQPDGVPDVPEPTPVTPYAFPEVPPPVFSVDDFTADVLEAPNLPDISVDVDADVTLEPFSVSASTQGLFDRLSSMQNFEPSPPDLPAYLQIAPEVFSVIGSMSQGTPVVDYLSLTANRSYLLDSRRGSTHNSFSRRNLTIPSGSAQYDGFLKGAIANKMDNSDSVYEAQAVDECVKSAYQLGVAANRMITDIKVSLYNLDFDLAKASADARLEAAKALAESYKAEVLILNSSIAQYNAILAEVEAGAEAFTAKVRAEAATGQINALKADVFNTTEQAKIVEGEAYTTRVSAEKQKIAYYASLIGSYKAFVSRAEADVTNFVGKVSLYSSEVDRLSNDYRRYASQAQAVQFDNSARADALSASGSELEAYASQAQASAASAAAQSTSLQAQAAVRETKFALKSLAANEDELEFEITGAQYKERVADYVNELEARAVDVDLKRGEGVMIARYVEQAQSAVGRSAQLSQTANEELSRAYQTVYEAAGRAGAAVATGKLSRFRASASLRASERLSGDNSYSTRYSGSGENSYSERDRYTA